MTVLAELQNLSYQSGTRKILHDISLTLFQGEFLGIAGESGSGKTTLIRCLTGYYQPTEGSIKWACQFSREQVGLVFQDPMSSLNPKMTIQQILEEPMRLRRWGNKGERLHRCLELLEAVQLEPEALKRYPRQFSGGQCQRIAIARAIAMQPRLLVCDEPLSALDAATQVDVALLLKKLQATTGMGIVMISHDLDLLRYLSQRIAVMQQGRIVESGPTEALIRTPKHPYTQILLESILSNS